MTRREAIAYCREQLVLQGIARAYALPATDAVGSAASCPEVPTTIGPLMDLYAPLGPLAKRYPPAVAWVNERARACFGARTLHLRAFVDGTGGIGGTTAYRMRPAWFLDGTVTVFATGRESSPGVGAGRVYGVALAPGLGDIQAEYAGRWVVLTGSFKDPRASRCRATGPAGETPDATDAVTICQSVFVVRAVSPADLPATTAAGRAPGGGASDGPSLILLLAAVAGGALGWRRQRRQPGFSQGR